jgi:dTMP kinase
MKTARYICFEGTEGVGKTTQTQKLVDYLRSKGYKVLQTKEPGTPHSPLTMTLRGIMLDAQYDKEMTRQSRELVSQAIRSIHLERVIKPAINEYDFIIQDRGILSGLAYGSACGNRLSDIWALVEFIQADSINEYDDVILLKGNVSKNLDRALQSKKEFAAGDAMEARGANFISAATDNMIELSRNFNTSVVNVDGKSVEQVFADILAALNIG